MMTLKGRLKTVLLLGLLLLIGATVGAEDAQPPRRVFTLPIEMDVDSGAANGDAVIMRLMPLAAFPMGERWKIVNLTLAMVADAPGGVPGQPGNPEPGEGGRVFGLGDLTNAVFFTPPSRSTKFVWGFGPGVGLPIATDPRLGSGKWTLGPAFRFAYRPGPWNLGAVVVNLFSVAGDEERADVNQLLIRGLIRRRLKDPWYFTYNPIITANWNAPADQRWLVPLGGGIGRTFTAGGQSVALSVHAYANVIKPDGAPEWLIRITFIVPIPKALMRR
jgi:hypothetical protein